MPVLPVTSAPLNAASLGTAGCGVSTGRENDHPTGSRKEHEEAHASSHALHALQSPFAPEIDDASAGAATGAVVFLRCSAMEANDTRGRPRAAGAEQMAQRARLQLDAKVRQRAGDRIGFDLIVISGAGSHRSKRNKP